MKWCWVDLEGEAREIDGIRACSSGRMRLDSGKEKGVRNTEAKYFRKQGVDFETQLERPASRVPKGKLTETLSYQSVPEWQVTKGPPIAKN